MTPARTMLPVLILALIITPLAPLADAHASDPHTAGSASQALGPDPAAAYAAAEAADLFGTFTRQGQGVAGAFMGFRVDADASALRDVRFRGDPLLTAVSTGMTNASTRADGPVFTLANATSTLAVHNNRHAWITFDGHAVTFRFAAGATASRGDDGAFRVHVGNVTMHAFARGADTLTWNGRALSASGTDGVTVTLTTTPGIFTGNALPGAWFLAAHANGTTAVDALPVLGPGYRVTDASEDRLGVKVVGTLGRGASASLVRVEAAGVFDEDVAHVLVHRGGKPFRTLPADRVAGAAQGGAAFNVTGDGNVVRTLFRVPPGEAGVVTVERDATPPIVEDVREEDLDGTWAPTARAPALVAVLDEPAKGRLVLTRPDGTTLEKPLSTFAREQRYRLVGLNAATTYAYAITVTDLMGNTATVHGNVTTPPAAEAPTPVVEVLTDLDAPLPPGRATVNFTVTDAEGAPWPREDVLVFFDKTPVTRDVEEVAPGRFQVTVTVAQGGVHELTVEARGADGTFVRHEVAGSAPAPVLRAAGLLALAGAAAVHVRRPKR